MTEPNQVWCCYVTYFWTGKHWEYLAVILDLLARKPVSWVIPLSPESRLTMKALEKLRQANRCDVPQRLGRSLHKRADPAVSVGITDQAEH